MQTANKSTLLYSLLLSVAVGLAHGQNSGTSSGYRTPRGNFTAAEQSGHGIYLRYCVGCHGVLGDGEGETAAFIDPKPRNFTTATFRCRSTPTGTLPTDQDLENTIERGIVNSNMPSWRPTSDQDRKNLVAYIKTFSPRWKTEKPGTPIQIPAAPTVTAERLKAGEALFQKLECWKCHGVEGRGNGPSAETLTDDQNRPIKAFNFHDGTRFKCGSTDQDLYKIFMTGLDGTPMPSFADNVKPDEAWDLVFYLRTLQPMRSKAKDLAKQLGLKPINPTAVPDGQSQEQRESTPAHAGAEVPAAPTASSQAPEAPPTRGESTPSAAPAAAPAGAVNPAPAQPAEVPPAAESKPAAAATPAVAAEGASSAEPAATQPSEAQPAPESQPSGTPVTGGDKAATSVANPVVKITPARPPSVLSRSPANHAAERVTAAGKSPIAELRQLAVGGEAGKLSVTLMLSGPVVPQLRKLDSPARVVVDLPNTVAVAPQHRIAVGRDGAKAVRVGMDGRVPPTTRVVVDLTRPLTYEMVPGSDNSWILQLHAASDTPPGSNR
jgi:mono/diheme cytochrome c family protein